MLQGLVFRLVLLLVPWVTFLRLLLVQQILGSAACLLLEHQLRWYTLMHHNQVFKDQAWAETSACRSSAQQKMRVCSWCLQPVDKRSIHKFLFSVRCYCVVLFFK